MAEQRLAARLEELSAFLARSSAADGVEELLAHLRDDAAVSMGGSRASAERCLRLLLGQETRGKDPPSLLAFLDACSVLDDDARKRELAQAALGVLQLLSSLVEAFGKHRAMRKQHAMALYRCCQSTARANDSNKVKAEALAVIINVLEECGHLLSAADVEPKVYAEKLFYDLRFGKATQTAKGQMLAVLGSLAKTFRAELEGMAEPLIAWTEKSLDQHFAAASPQFQIISGLLFALARLVVFDPERYEKKVEARKKIYSYVHSVLAATVAGNLSRYHVTRAALQFLTQLAHSFREEIAENAYTWFTFMKFCSTNDNKTIRDHTPACAAAVLCELNRFLVANQTDANKKSLNRMLKDVLPSITNAGVSSADVGFSINALGNLTGSIATYLGHSALMKIEDKLRSYGEALMTLNEKETAKSWSLFSRYVKCTGAFIREAHHNDLDDNYIGFVGDILCHVLNAYPFCAWETKSLISSSFLAIFSAISKCTVVDTLIDRVVYHTLLLSMSTVSDPTQVMLYHPETGNEVVELVYSYIDFWIALLGKPQAPTSSNQSTTSQNDRLTNETSWKTQRRKVLDAFMKNLIDLIQSLDLSYSFETQTTVTSSDYGGLKPSVPRDHAIILNLAELVERVFPRLDQRAITPWVPRILKVVVSAALALPLISSYYRIGAVLIAIAEEKGYFHDETGSGVTEDSPELKLIYSHLVSVTSDQLRFFQDELLVASAKFVLATPVALLDTDQAKAAIYATLSLGTSYLPAAEISLSALEKWQRQDGSRLQSILEDVIPLLGPYLDKRADEAPEVLKSTKTTVPIKEEDRANDYARLQRRVLMFLGSVGGIASTVISRPAEKLPNISGRTGLSSEELILSLSLNDATATIAIDGIMLEIGELALRATERRVKVSACETFHGMVSYLCGKTATQPHPAGSKTIFYGLWRASFAIVLKLAIDPEKIARTLFEPLLFQLVRWLSSSAETYPFEYADILDYLIGSLSNPSSSVRAMACKCITASLRVTVDTRNARSTERAGEIFGRLFSLCRHPSIIQRSGSAMTISHFMRSLGEADQSTVKTFAVKCLMSLLVALQLSDRDTRVDAGGKFTSQNLIKRAIRKIEHEIARTPDLFLQLHGSESEMSLAEITKWLFQRIAVRERTFRTVCRGTFVTLSALVSGSSCKQWIADYAASREIPLIADIIIPITTIANALAADVADDRVLEWMETFCASVEAYTWLTVVLEGAADEIFEREQQFKTTNVKRKRDSVALLQHESTKEKPTLNESIRIFLKFRVGHYQQAALQYRMHESEYYAEGLSVVCELAWLALTSKDPSLIQALDPENPAIVAAVTEKVVELLKSPQAELATVESLAEIKRHFEGIVRLNSLWRCEIQRHLLYLGDALERSLDSSVPRKDVEELIDSTAKVFYELVELDVVSVADVSKFGNLFFRAAEYFMKNNPNLPDYYASVVAAIKTASACGFAVTTIYTDHELVRQCGPMHNDIIRVMSLVPVWRVCAEAIIKEACTSSETLSALIGITGSVASGKVLKPHTVKWGQFAQSMASQLPLFVRHISDAQVGSQTLRKMLESLGYMLKILESTPQSMLVELCKKHCSQVSDAIMGILSSRNYNYLVKVDALRVSSTLLSILRLSAYDGAVHSKLLTCLQRFMIAEFPIQSRDVKHNSRDYDVFRTLFLELLTVVERSGNGLYLRLLFPCLREGEQHLFFQDIQSSLARFSESIIIQTSEASRSDLDQSQHLKTTLDILHDLTGILLDPLEQPFVRQLILDRVFIPFIELQPPETIKAFFLSKDSTTTIVMLTRLTAVASAAIDATKQPDFAVAVAFHMLDILFRFVDPESIRGELNEVFLGHKNGKGREFTMLVCKNASKAVTTKMNASDGSQISHFIRCGAYSCLLTAVSRTQRQEKFFDQLLFQSGVLNNIIDCSSELVLKATTDAFSIIPLSRFSPCTQANRERGIDHRSKSTARRNGSSSISQSIDFFSASSLSQFDSLASIDATQVAVDGAFGGIELELDPINAHPCMASLLRTIVEMKTQFGAAWDPHSMPTWMKKIHETMSQAGVHLNVRLFITRLILNAPSIFEPYASSWLPLVFNTLVETGISTNAEFHYLFRDVCVLVLDTWSSLEEDVGKDECSRFINTLIGLCPHPNNAVRDDNILLVTRLMIRWKEIIDIDSGILAEFLFCDEEDNTRVNRAKRFTGLQLVSALVSAQLTASHHETTNAEPGRSLQDGIMLAMKDPKALVYTLAAEVGGVLMTTTDYGNFSKMHDFASIILDAYNQEDYQRFLAILRNVSLHKPEIIDSAMLGRLVFVLPKAVMFDSWALHGIEAVENATRNGSVRDEICSHLRGVFDRFIHHRDDRVRLTTLRVIEALLDTLSAHILEVMCASPSEGGCGLLEVSLDRGDPEYRRLLFQVIQKIAEKYPRDESLSGHVRTALLNGLFDQDSQIRDRVLGFCSASDMLPPKSAERLLELFNTFYAPSVANSWALYSTNLLLELAQQSTDIDNVFFSNSLCDSEFVEAAIDTTTDSKTLTMAPLFSLDADAATSGNVAHQRGGFMPGSLNTFDDSSVSQLVSSTIASQSGSDLPVVPGPKSNFNRSRRFVQTRGPSESSKQVNFGLGDKIAQRRFFQEKHKIANKVMNASRQRERKARSDHVTLRRKYRVGEYPDIQISLRDILSPLMVLCGAHHATSSRIFSEIFGCIVEASSHLLDQLLTAITRALEESKWSGAFVSCLHRAYFHCLANSNALLDRFQLSSKVLAESSLASGAYYSGELVLEELLIHNIGAASTQDLNSNRIIAEQWDQLHKIIGTIQKQNFLLAIASKSSAIGESRKALEARLMGNLPTAIASYDKAESILESQMEITGENSPVAVQLDARRCYWQRLGCLETLNSWTKLEHAFQTREVGSDNYVWSEVTPYLEQAVGHKLRCALGIRDDDLSDRLNHLQTFIENAKVDPKRWKLLCSKYAVETTLAYMKLNDQSQARIIVDSVYSNFLQQWQNTNSLSVVPRLELMQLLSSTVQLDEVLTLVGNARATSTEYLGLVEKWAASCPEGGEGSVAAWSQFFQVQDITNDFMWERGSDIGLLTNDDRRDFSRAKSVVMLGYASAALSNDIMALTSRYLKEYRELCNAAQLPKVSVPMVEVFVSHVLKLAERQLQELDAANSSVSVDTIVRYFQTATKLFDNVDVLDLVESISSREQMTLCTLEAQAFGDAARYYMKAELDHETFEEYFLRSLEGFQRSCNACSGLHKSTATTVDRELIKPRLAFIKFLSELLSSNGGSKWETIVEKKAIVQNLVNCALDGMICGSQECATFFPQLFDLIAPFPDLIFKFEEKVLREVPLWTSLQWSAQLMALLNSQTGSTVLKILEKLAEQYPAALFYEFKVSRGMSNSAFAVDVRRLETLLANAAMEKFVDALRLIHHPEIRLKEGLREVAKLLDAKNTREAQLKMTQVFDDCFSLDRSTLGVHIGRYNREWARKARRDIEKIMGKNASNLTMKTVSAARDWVSKNFSVSPGKYGITRDMKAHLADFAEWLDQFDPSKHRLELPGQYTARWGKPDPSRHVTILSFDSILGVLPSKQLPKRLILHCSDERNYTFLVKGGEDLRLDQRIEQLFGVMNHVLSIDPQCRNRQLSNRTYQVIPMTREIGLIEWLDGTATLKSVIEAQLRQDERCAHLLSNKRQKLELFNTTAAKTYEGFHLKQRGASFSAKVIAPSSRDVKKTFDQVQSEIPADLLRRQLLRLGSSYDTFLTIRDRFLSSLAVFNSCSYVLGIGDRHLDNFLLDLSDGRVVGIDFGVSFGAGASLLPVPELIPFRYTRQMDAVFLPYDGQNLVAQEMQRVFEALRAKKQVIESVLNVFLHEPLMDWQQQTTTFQSEIYTKTSDLPTLVSQSMTESDGDNFEEPEPKAHRTSRSGRSRGAASGSASSSTASTIPLASSSIGGAWLPNVKIAIARRKLDGFSPQTLLKEELSQNVHLKPHLSKFHALVDGVGGGNASSSLSGEPSAELSALAQAQELLALATAPDVLGRTYFGWMPWL